MIMSGLYPTCVSCGFPFEIGEDSLAAHMIGR